MRTAVEQIKEKLGIVEVVSTYVKLDRAGANLKGKCPFHNEKTASFFVSPSRNTYYCFGCNVKGDVFTFIQEFEKVDFKGALKILAERAGVTLTDFNPAEVKEKDVLFEIMQEACSYFEKNLSENPAASKYLLERGLKEKTIKEWRIGYASSEWNALGDFLKSLPARPPSSGAGGKFKESDIEKAGLIKKGEKGSMYDRFRGRIMFPIFDSSGRVIAFSGRIFASEVKPRTQRGLTSLAGSTPKTEEAKYINSPDTALFNKSEVLYGLHIAKNVIRQKKFALLVEGQLDLLMCHQAGLNQAVATSGTALTEGQLLLLKRFSSNLMIAYDGDKAGISASKRAFIIALSLGFDVKVAPLPEGSDPADTINKDPEEFKNILRKALHIIDFTLQATLQKGLEGRALLKDVKENVLPYVNATASPIERAYFITSISEKIHVPESALYEELSIIGDQALKQSSSLSKSTFDRPEARPGAKKESIERKIAGLFWTVDEDERTVMEEKFKRLFEDMLVPPTRFAEASARRELGEGGSAVLTLSTIASPYEGEKEALVFEAERDMGEKKGDYFGELMVSLKREILKAELDIATSDLRQAEKEGDTKRVGDLLKVCRELTSRLSYLKI